MLVVSSESEDLPKRLDAHRQYVQAHAHRNSHVHVFVPAGTHPARHPLLHPHHNHNHNHDDDYHDDYDYCCGHDDYDCGCFSAGENYYYSCSVVL